MTGTKNSPNTAFERSSEIMQAYIQKFGTKPYIIGMFWNNRERFNQNLIDAIESGVPYNEYELLVDDKKKAFDEGLLLF
jgi:hypothetical protein